MKLRDLQQGAGTAMVWPPLGGILWARPHVHSGRGRRAEGPSADGQPAVAADHDQRPPAHDQHGVGPPPAVGDVEVALLASIGAEIRRLGDLEVPTGKRGARG